MQDKELEKILQEKADKIELRDFSEVWKEIEPVITAEKKEKPKWNKKLSLVFAAAAIVVCAAITPIVVNMLTPPPEELFFADDLDRVVVSVEKMFSDLSAAEISHVALTNYEITGSNILITETQDVKGAEFSFLDNAENTTFFAQMQLYDKSVDLNVDLKEYDQYKEVNSAQVHYKLKQVSDGLYDYNVYATCNGVQYLIEYTGLSDNLTEFLTEFFS